MKWLRAISLGLALSGLIARGTEPVLRVNSGHTATVSGVTATADGALVFSWENETLFIWEAGSGLLLEVKPLDSEINDVLVLDSDRKALVGTQKQLHTVSLDTFEVIATTSQMNLHSMIHEPLLDTVYGIEDHMAVQIDPASSLVQRLTGYQQAIPFADGSSSLYGFPSSAELIPYNDALSIVVNEGKLSHFDVYALGFSQPFADVSMANEATGGIWTATTFASLDGNHLIAGGLEQIEEGDTVPSDYILAVLRKEDFGIVARVKLAENVTKRTAHRFKLPPQSWNHPEEPVIVIDGKSLRVLHWDGKHIEFLRERSLTALPTTEVVRIEGLQPIPKRDGAFIVATTYRRESAPRIDRLPMIEEIAFTSTGAAPAQRALGEFPLTPNVLEVHPTQDLFLVGDESGAAKTVRWEAGSLQVDSAPQITHWPRFSGDGADLTWLDEYSQRWSLSSMIGPVHWGAARRTQERFISYRRSEQMAVSRTGNLVATNISGILLVTNLRTGEVIRKVQPPAEREFTQYSWGGAAFSPNEKTLVYVTKSQAPITSGSSSLSWKFTIRALDLESGDILWDHVMTPRPIAVRFLGESTLCVLSDRTLRHRLLDTVTGEVLAAEDLYSPEADRDVQNETVTAVAFSPNLDRGAVARDDLVAVLSPPHPGSISFLPRLGSRILSLAFLNSDRYLLIGTADNKVRLWDIDEMRELAAMAFFELDDEWVMSTPDFQFDASPGGEERMFFAQGNEAIPLAALYENFHTPRLLSRLLGTESLAPPFAPSLLVSPPAVTLATEVKGEEVTVTMDASSATAPILEIRLYHNGKVVSAQQRGLFVEDDEPAPEANSEEAPRHHQRRVVKLSLLEGPNEFRAIALNEQRSESAPALTIVEGPTFETRGGFRLHMLIVGIDTYDNPKLSLNYARADATAFADLIQSQAKGLFTERNITMLLDGEATRSRILAELETIAAATMPRDVVVFYYAGHGAMSGAATPEFFLIPPGVTQLYGNDQVLRDRAISATQLRDLAARIPAQKQLFLLDACQSAGALETIAMRGAAQERAIAQLARSTGTYWLTATGTEQFATEFAALGHGAFTYSIIEALKDHKGDINGDGQITVRELDTFLQSRVPELTREQRGSSQHPASFGYGQDFPFALTNERTE